MSSSSGGGNEISGHDLYGLVEELYPYFRSITGEGLRRTLGRLAETIPLELREVPSGIPVFDWTVPKEWTIRRARIRDPEGRVVVDMGDSNLHVVSYSTPVRERMSLDRLRDHLHTLPDRPDWIPYRTTYYEEDWGFCLRDRTLEGLQDGQYEVLIDSELRDGHLTYGECFLPGESEEEVLISTHCCHPSLCNDNLSGIAVATGLARSLMEETRRYSYRFLFIPGTIGSITWLARNEDVVPRIRHGLVLTGVGDAGAVTYKRTRQGGAEIDRAVEHVMASSGRAHEIRDFSPYGYDERQYGSPGFMLPVGCLMRTPHGEYPEYHTSADDLDFVEPDALADTYRLCRSVFEVLENNQVFRNRNPKCEPQLGKRGLYRDVGGSEISGFENALLWVLSFSDGDHSLLDIARRSGLQFRAVRRAAEALRDADLLDPEAPPAEVGDL